jgi:hypothetical protein
VWIVAVVGVLVVHAMPTDPPRRRILPAAQCQHHKRSFQPSGHFEAAVRQQAMVADRHAQLAENVHAQHEREQARPTKQPRNECQQGQQVQA